MEIGRTCYLGVPHSCSFLFLLRLLCLLLLLLFLFHSLLCRGCWSSIPPKKTMDSLPRGVNPDLPKNKLIRNLVSLPTSELFHHRLALFREACNQSLVSPDYVNLPLVGRKDTAIKPASHKLSEDIWTIISCIRNKENIPRTLFKNGKRSKTFLSQVSQVSQVSHENGNHSHSSTSPPAL